MTGSSDFSFQMVYGNLINYIFLMAIYLNFVLAARQPHLTSLQCSTPARGGSRASSQVGEIQLIQIDIIRYVLLFVMAHVVVCIYFIFFQFQ